MLAIFQGQAWLSEFHIVADTFLSAQELQTQGADSFQICRATKVLCLDIVTGRSMLIFSKNRFSFSEYCLAIFAVLQVNNLDTQPDSENLSDDMDEVDLSNMSEIDDVNIHILQELEEDF